MWLIIHAFVWLVLLPMVAVSALEWIALGAMALWCVVSAPFRLLGWVWRLAAGEHPSPDEVQRKREAAWMERERKLEKHLECPADRGHF